MRLSVPFPYTVSFTRPRRRNPETVTLLGRIEVEVPEIRGAVAPVAMRCTYEGFSVAESRHTSVERAYRALDGNRLVSAKDLHVGQAYYTHCENPYATVTATNAQDKFDAWERRALAVREGFGWLPTEFILLGENKPVYVCQPEADLVYREMLSNDRDVVAERVRQTMAGAAFIDGLLHLPSAGPGYLVLDEVRQELDHPDPNGMTHGYFVGINVIPEIDHHSSNGASVFRADRLVEARAEAERRAHQRRRAVGKVIGVITILNTAVLTHDDDANALRAAARDLLVLSGPVLHKLPTVAIRAYADLRDQLAACADRALTAEEGEALLMSMHELNDHWAPGHQPTGRHAPPNPVRRYLDRLAADPRRPDPAAEGGVEITADEIRRLGL